MRYTPISKGEQPFAPTRLIKIIYDAAPPILYFMFSFAELAEWLRSAKKDC